MTVYPDRARVTRRGPISLPAGLHRVQVGPLPLNLQRDSIRVGGTGPATVLGVDVVTQRHDQSPDPTVVDLEAQRWTVSVELTELADADAVEAQRAEFLGTLAQRAGSTYARALAAGEATPADVGTFAESVAGQLSESRARQRELTGRRRIAEDRLAMIERKLKALTGRQRPDRLAAEVAVEVGADDAEVQLELSYVVTGAGWQSSYDLRLIEDNLTLTWFGLVTQRTGEDWPECELLLSTARPSASATVPELDPWYLDRVRPPAPVAPAPPTFGATMQMAAMPEPAGAVPRPAPMARTGAAPVRESVATIEQGVAAATYRPTRPVAVPADGTAHRATVALLELPATLDYLPAPVRAEEAHLRATVVNGSTHTLPAGKASVFHGNDFVAGTQLPRWAPGEEVELALGLDDRVRVERELARRSDTKATLGSTRRREVEYRITVANHTPRAAAVTVLDQLPVSRDEAVVVRELRLEPAPAERGDLGRLSWRLQLAAGESREILIGLRVELAKGIELAGWRE